MTAHLLARLTRALAARYTVERELGRGGMARVFLAEEQHPKRPVAIKVLDPEIAAVLGPDRALQGQSCPSSGTDLHTLFKPASSFVLMSA